MKLYRLQMTWKYHPMQYLLGNFYLQMLPSQSKTHMYIENHDRKSTKKTKLLKSTESYHFYLRYLSGARILRPCSFFFYSDNGPEFFHTVTIAANSKSRKNGGKNPYIIKSFQRIHKEYMNSQRKGIETKAGMVKKKFTSRGI